MIHGEAHGILDLGLSAVYMLDVVALLAKCRVHLLSLFNLGLCSLLVQGPVQASGAEQV